MKTIHYDISSIDQNNIEIFKDMLSYVSEHIVNYKFNNSYAEIDIKSDQYYDEVMQKIRLLNQMLDEKNFDDDEQIKTNVLLDFSDRQTINKEPIFNKLIESRDVLLMMPGVYAFSSFVLAVCNYFTRKVKDFLITEFKEYKEIKFPKLYPINEFENSGYFEKFPQHIMFQSVLKNDIETLEEFSKNGINANFLNNIKTPGAVLKNASCVPIYPMIENTRFENQESAEVFYVTGKCFRNEGSNVKELSRLNEFTMSEIVFIGTDELIQEGIEKAKKLWNFWIKTFNLNCKVETANDSFFAGSYKKLRFFQLIGNSKEEFKWLLPHSDDYIATASANYHRTHFTKRYNIESEKGFCHSSCIAFGIERLTYALLCQKGLDIDKWDPETKNEISKYIALK